MSRRRQPQDPGDAGRKEPAMAEIYDQETREGGTFEYPIKCLNCGLHYSVYSWTKWADEHELGGYCPECGIRGHKIVYGPVERNEFIFQLVPGKAEVHSMTRPEDVAPFGLGNMRLSEEE